MVDAITGKGPSARTVQLDLPPFTLVAATTRIALLSAPLRARFSGGVYRLDPYSDDEMVQIIQRSADILQMGLDHGAIMGIVAAARSTPRTANYLLKRVRDYAQVHETPVSLDTTKKAVALIGVDELGLTQAEVQTFHGMLRQIAYKLKKQGN